MKKMSLLIIIFFASSVLYTYSQTPAEIIVKYTSESCVQVEDIPKDMLSPEDIKEVEAFL